MRLVITRPTRDAGIGTRMNDDAHKLNTPANSREESGGLLNKEPLSTAHKVFSLPDMDVMVGTLSGNGLTESGSGGVANGAPQPARRRSSWPRQCAPRSASMTPVSTTARAAHAV